MNRNRNRNLKGKQGLGPSIRRNNGTVLISQEVVSYEIIGIKATGSCYLKIAEV